MNARERKFYKENLTEVLHTTLNPYEPSVVRIHLIPAKYESFKATPSVVILNGKDILPINLSWTILLAIFIKQVNQFKGNEVTEEELKQNHSKMPHGGMVIRSGSTGDNTHVMEFSLKLDSNPEFTASVLTAYARAAVRLNREGRKGAMTVLDIPLSYLTIEDPFWQRKNLL